MMVTQTSRWRMQMIAARWHRSACWRPAHAWWWTRRPAPAAPAAAALASAPAARTDPLLGTYWPKRCLAHERPPRARAAATQA